MFSNKFNRTFGYKASNLIEIPSRFYGSGRLNLLLFNLVTLRLFFLLILNLCFCFVLGRLNPFPNLSGRDHANQILI